MQLILSWIHGSLLHRQHQDLLALREDVQILTDSVEQGFSQEGDAEESVAPARHASKRAPRVQRVFMVQEPPTEEDQARKELQETEDSAKKAVSKAREVRSQLSIEENIRKADEKAKMDSAENSWVKWLWVALGAGLVAMVVRAWLRRRG